MVTWQTRARVDATFETRSAFGHLQHHNRQDRPYTGHAAAMACTTHKTVQWSDENKINEFVYGSPYSEASSADSVNATSTLHYINSQLLAHGFARGSGVSFEGLSKEDADKLSKCMLGLLNQRNVCQQSFTLSSERNRIIYNRKTCLVQRICRRN